MMEAPQRILLLVLVALSGIASESFAVTIILKSRDEPVRGYLVEETTNEVRIRQTSSRGSKVMTYQRSQIEDIFYPIDDEKLSGLSPDAPNGYRDYAEQLVVNKEDPEARDLATRLFLIAAHLDPERLGRSCALAMTNLATSEAQRERCRALAYILDPKHDRDLLEDKGTVATAKGSNDTALLAMLEAILRSEMTRAKGIAKREDLDVLLGTYQDVLTVDEASLVLATPSFQQLSSELRIRVLRTYHRVLLRRTPGGTPLRKRTTKAWTMSLLNADNQEPVRPLSLETITPYDPTMNVYRNGKWQASDTP